MQIDRHWPRLPLARLSITLLIALVFISTWDVQAMAASNFQLEAGAAVNIASLAVIDEPISVAVIDKAGAITHISGRYSAVNDGTAVGKVTTPGGSVIEVTDRWSDRGPGSLALQRRITVLTAGSTDAGFRTELQVRPIAPAAGPEQNFIPGIWYGDTAHVPQSGMITALPGQHDFLFREDRMPLPLAMLRAADGVCITVVHEPVDGCIFGGTFKDEYTLDTIIDHRLQFASLGFHRDQVTSVKFAFPGVEGDQTRLQRYRAVLRRAERFSPAAAGETQQYAVMIHCSRQADFDSAMRDAWRTAYSAAAPKTAAVNVDRLYGNSIDLLDHFGRDYSGVPGFPFSVKIPSGEIEHVSMQMGFVGEQIPCAGELIDSGLKHQQPERVMKGARIIDFWSQNTLSPQGVPRTWYDVEPAAQWRRYNTFMRVATDGMQGMLQAWRRMKLAGQDKPAWLKCCRTFGDWLVTRQNSDGSFCRQYDFSGQVVDPSRSAALHPVRFLLDLSLATGDRRYRSAADRAGHFAVKDIGGTANYYGGTADNADVKDKEAGWIALDSFLSLYEIDHDPRWLTAAQKAADFTETWIYCWNVPISRDDPKVSLPPMDITGSGSLIATGHSGADVFLAFGPFAFYRLYLYTGDAHDADIARLLMYNARQWADIDGSLHYALPGLMTEATNIAAPRGWGVGVWLPWCTAAVVEPLQQFDDAFGTFDLSVIERMPLPERQKRLQAYSVRHAFPEPSP